MLGNRIEQTSTTTGTGTYSLTGTVADRNAFIGTPPNGFATTSSVFYTAIDKTNGGWEIGIGVVTDLATDTLTRATILGSSNGGLAVNWPAGTRNIYNDVPSELFGPMGGRLLKATAGGSANAITGTCAVPLRALTDGAIVEFETGGADSSGAITYNQDGTGAVALRDAMGVAFSATYVLKANQKVLAMYSAATGFWHVLSYVQAALATTSASGVVQLADAAAMEAETAGRVVTADIQKRHPGHPKFAINIDQTGTLTNDWDFGVASLTDTAAGRTLITFDTAFSAADMYAVATSAEQQSAATTGETFLVERATQGTTTVGIESRDNATLTDHDSLYVIGAGDQ